MNASIFLLAGSLALLGQSFPQQLPPEKPLPDVQAIQAWAGQMSWGGYRLDEYRWKGHQIVITRRAHTSGVESCSLNVFVKEKDGWINGIALRPFHGCWLEIEQKQDEILVVNSGTKDVVFRFSISGIDLQSFERPAK
jgi:hypothetical protein